MDLDNMTVEQIEKLEHLIKLKDEAKQLYSDMIKNQKIGLEPTSDGVYILWKDDHNREYLKADDGHWTWVAAYLHQHYEVPITEDGIFNMMKAGYVQRCDDSQRGRVNNYDDAIGYFRSYINHRLLKK